MSTNLKTVEDGQDDGTSFAHPKSITVRRTGTPLVPDRSRVLVRPFWLTSEQRCVNLCARVMSLSEGEIRDLLDQIMAEFSGRHQQMRDLLKARFEQVQNFLLTNQKLSEARKMVIGAYFTHEYSLEAAALFNPSIVPHPDQSNLPEGALRFIVSFRATGEGHISSVTFRTGVVDADRNVTINTPTRFLTEPRQIPSASYDKALFERKLYELGLTSQFSRRVLDGLGSSFTLRDLRKKTDAMLQSVRALDPESETVARGMLLLAQSNYEVQFAPESRVSERVIFPTSPSQSNGIEDARFVLFRNDDGTRVYYATYTAFDGKVTLPQFLETSDFLHFKFITLNGPAVKNKGMALFPRKIGENYAMLSRQDNENIYVMYSENLHFWYAPELVLKPTFPWEFVQLGNCGSPIETEAGWLVLSHGVGPMRKYCIGAFLLDKEDPTRVIGRLRAPLLKPTEHEREGYVPNVVYTCGALAHGRDLILPYAMSDYATNFALLSIDEIIAAME
ncbi:MAG: glycoside hydrolase family 130 protein [Verrucomicrobia subdivision 3 bacterium]|nr:glycoside hydrolase family 130 protein [Limisphaerales bacterium]